jgi:D-alanine-D-alanine ligase
MIPRKEDLKTDFPILIFFNLDLLEWTEKDQKDVLELVLTLKEAMEKIGHCVSTAQLSDFNIADSLSKYDPNKFIVFNWCEGIPGIPHSFAKAAQTLEDLGFTYTGSNPSVLELTDDKRKVKKILDTYGISTPYWKVYNTGEIKDWNRFPAIVKPPFEHCSIGISPESVVNNLVDLRKRAEFVIEEFHQPVIVEDFIDGREFQVGVWGNAEVEVLPPVEADFSQLEDSHDHLCTVDSKDDPDSYRYQKWNMIVPAVLNSNEFKKLNKLCKDAYEAIGVRDYARMDVRLKKDRFYILDVNTNPYIGPECGLIKAAELVGYSYGEFGSQLVNLAYQRNKIKFS